MESNKKVTCIVCPKGCRINVKVKNGEIVSIENYDCKRGLEYAKNEVLDPRRILTTTLKLSGGRVLPVRTKDPIPKKLLKKAMHELKDVIITPPVKVGDIVAKNVAGTGIDLIATGNAK
jgi:CxxC motif-containing protein